MKIKIRILIYDKCFFKVTEGLSVLSQYGHVILICSVLHKQRDTCICHVSPPCCYLNGCVQIEQTKDTVNIFRSLRLQLLLLAPSLEPAVCRSGQGKLCNFFFFFHLLFIIADQSTNSIRI